MLFEIDSYITSPNVLLVGVIISVFTYLYTRVQDPPNLPRGPRGLPLIGNVSTLATKNAAKHMMKLKESYGSLLYLKMFGFRMMIIQDYKTMKEAFVEKGDKTSWRHSQLLPRSKELFPEPQGIFLNVGEMHKVMRRFTLNALRDFGVGKQSFEDKITEEAIVISELLLSNTSPIKSTDLKMTFQRGISNLIISICFGHRYNYDNKQLQEVLAKLDALLRINLFAQPSLYFPFIRHFSFLGDRVDEAMQLEAGILDFIRGHVDQHRATLDLEDIRDFTDLCLKEEQQAKASDTKVTEANLLRAIFDLFLAGSESTATSMSWIVFFMAKHPEVQQKMYDEIQKVIGDRPPTYRDHQDMPFVSAVLLESWRLANLTPLGIPHTVSEDFILDGKFIPKDTMLLPNMYAIHMNDEYWGNPEVFQPERFIDSNGNIKRHEELVPFSIGPRSCVGEHLARMETFLFLTHFVQKMTFAFSDQNKDYDVTECMEALIRLPQAHEIVIKSRE